jgi:hypothetical protein
MACKIASQKAWNADNANKDQIYSAQMPEQDLSMQDQWPESLF